MLLQISLLIICLNYAVMQISDSRTIEVLTSNFFDNLRGDLSLIVESDLNQNSKQFIEKQIDNYIAIVTHRSITNKKKRSLLDKFTKHIKETYLLDVITPTITIPARFPVDITLFVQNSSWFAAALECSDITQSADYLVIFSYQNQTFNEKTRVPIINGLKLATITTENNNTLIVVAENATSKTNLHNKSGIYQFNGSKLIKIQYIDMHFANDIVMWRIHNEIYMSIAQFMSNKTGDLQYELEIPIYKWLGKHFDLVQSITSKGAKALTPFTVDQSHFLGIANFRNNKGNTNIYSEIYKYNFHEEKYTLHQRIVTRACTDIKVFTLSQNNRQRDTFLIVANSEEKDFDESTNYEVDSIIYKLVDNYFIPFETLQLTAVQQWLPVKGPNDEFVLIASCRFDGLRYFQYDGWSFREVTTSTPESLQNTEIKSLRFVDFKNSSVMVVSNKNNKGNIANVFQVKFVHQITLNKIFDNMITWCDDGLGKVATIRDKSLMENLLGKAERADINEELGNIQLSEINLKIKSLNSVLSELEIPLMQVNDTLANDIFLKNITFIHVLNTSKINQFPTNEFLQNILNTDNGFQLENVNVSPVKIEGHLSIKNINRQNINSLIYRFDNLTADCFKIRGNTIAAHGINIKEKLNEISVNDQNLLLRKGSQNFLRPLILEDAIVDKMMARSVNNYNLVVIKQMMKNDSIDIHYVKNLEIKNLTIGGYINNVDIPTLEKYALKKLGEQKITSHYIFDTLKGHNLNVHKQIVEKKLSHLIPTYVGKYFINIDLIFEKDLIVNNLKIADSLNGIGVHNNGKLDILLNNCPKEQEITSNKVFYNVIIDHAIYLQGHINSKNLEKMNPVLTIDKDILLKGGKTISGLVQVENFVSAKDIITLSHSSSSLKKLQNYGLKLTTKEIQVHINFVQQLTVDEVFLDTINKRDPHDFVITGTDETQIIESAKTFLGNIHITGPTNAIKINNVDVEELENKVLKVEGDQIIAGKHFVKHVIVDSVLSKKTRHQTNIYNDTVRDINLDSLTLDDFQTNKIICKTIFVKRLLNNFLFDNIINDTVIKTTNNTINGHTFFKTLSIHNLNLFSGVTTYEKFTDNDELIIDGPIALKHSTVENIYFENKCNGVNKAIFDTNKNKSSIMFHINESLDNVVVYGDTFITSNKINNIEVTDLLEKTVKLDEPFEFNFVTFETEAVSKNTLTLDGHIENFDFENVVLQNSNLVFNQKMFNNFTINKNTSFGKFINNFNITQLCSISKEETDQDDKNFTINGNAFFAKGPNVVNVNDVSVQNITNSGWFSDQNATLMGSVQFEDVIFQDYIQVEGYVDNVSLNFLYDNYFSNTKDQHIAAIYSYTNNLIFEHNISIPKITLSDGRINKINLNTFVRTALIQDFDQTFEIIAFFENCHVQNLKGSFATNTLDLGQDVMRYDKINMVTSPKNLKNLNVVYLKLDKLIKIQKVDLLQWFKNSILKTTSFNVTRSNTFGNTFFENKLQLSRSLNGIIFDQNCIMIKNIQQHVTGVKHVYADKLYPVSFKDIKLKGLLNHIDISHLINNHAFKNQDNTFKTTINLNNNITTNNLVVKNSYDGINMSELITNVTNLGVLNNLLLQYIKLLNMSQELKQSIREQAYFMHHYKIVQTINVVTKSKKIYCLDEKIRIGSLTSDDSGVRMDLYGWHDKTEEFKIDATIKFEQPLDYVDQVFMGRYLYFEEHNAGIGRFSLMSNLEENGVSISTNLTRTTISFKMPITDEACVLFTYYECAPRIFCETNKEVKLMQILDNTYASMASTLTIKRTLYLVLINEPINGVESHIDVWRFNNQTSRFEHDHSIFEAHPRSIATVSYNGFHYLAIASGHLQNAIYSGRVEIRRFNEETSEFVPWQNLLFDAPIQVEFSILFSDELVLYVVTDNPTEPLLVFRYEGISRFTLSVAGATLPQILYINQFRWKPGQHFIVAQSHDQINVIQTVFKGEKVTDN